MKHKIVILADFPIWIIDSSVSVPNTHFAVWLVSLYQSLHLLCDRYEFHWITLNKAVKKRKIIESNKQFFHILPERSLRLGQLLHYVRERFLISNEIKKINPDLVHAWGTEKYYALAAKSFKGKKILSMQGVLSACVKRAPMAPFQTKQSKFEPTTLKAFSVVTAESIWAVERCREIAPCINIIQWEYSANAYFFHIKRNISEQRNCVFAGTDTALKDVESAIKAFSNPLLSHIKLYLAGIDISNHPNLPPNIIAMGRVGREKIANLLKSTWCVVHPSLADSCPNIIKEARVIGIPCIVTDECGGKQYIENGLSGFVIPVKSPDKIIEAVLSITKDKNTSITMGKYKCEQCRNALSEETMLNRIKNIYSHLI